jgi:hypothetical protein
MKNANHSNHISNIPVTGEYKPSKWERELQRELQDPNRFYDGDYSGDSLGENFSIKAVRLG